MPLFRKRSGKRRSSKESRNGPRMSEDFRSSPAALAELVTGTWDSDPLESWTLQRIRRLRSASKRTNEEDRNTLLYASRPKKFIKQFNENTRYPQQFVLMVPADSENVDTEAAVLRVPSVPVAANTIARSFRDEFAGRVIAITGSMGKTTVKTMMSTVLSRHHDVFTSHSDMNGIAAARARLLSLGAEEYAVFEVPRVILPGAEEVLRPDVVVVTAIAEAHMEALGTLENTAEVKASLLRGLTPGGSAIINRDMSYADRILEVAHEYAGTVLTYGEGPNSDIRLLDYDPVMRTVTADLRGKEFRYTIGASGRHNAINSLAVLGSLKVCGLDPVNYLDGFSEFQAVEGRGQVTDVALRGKSVTLVDQSFNANPLSIRAAVRDFSEQYQGRSRVLVLGDMLELGPTSGKLHEDLVTDITEAEPDQVYLVGPLMTGVWAHLPKEMRVAHVMKASLLLSVMPSELKDNAAVLFKASQGTGLGALVEAWRSEPGDTSLETRRVVVEGPRIQGVGFRRWAKKIAESYSAEGWIRNLSDGTVEMLVRSDRESIAEILSKVHLGPKSASVDRVTSQLDENVPEPGFRIRGEAAGTQR